MKELLHLSIHVAVEQNYFVRRRLTGNGLSSHTNI
ncbi:hypothetical protein P879_11516 [Paragonimus westermani]|uniref:Uncharacterized protein n=1 Tax=Paragonimus westermani TaxID=34504 RepID=A0A8T0D4T8_9TREM|nr:hypothetical protein P879_11516 [Paragonimus westermani]